MPSNSYVVLLALCHILISGVSLDNKLSVDEGLIMDQADATGTCTSLLQSRSYKSGGRMALHTNCSLQRPVQGNGTQGVIHFLFMIHSHIPFADIWKRFFQCAPAHSFRVWIHCSGTCNQTHIQRVLPQAQVVPPTFSSYCHDLVSPFVQLLKHALYSQEQQVGIREKFVLLSETVLPVKPYRIVYDTLMADDLSDFGVLPTGKWPHAAVNGSMVKLVKSSQWVVLNRMHAAKMVSVWQPPPANSSLRTVKMDLSVVKALKRWQFHPRVGLGSCTDEEVIYEILCGTLEYNLSSNSGITSSQQIVKTCEGTADVVYPWKRAQGRGRTFVLWKWDIQKDSLIAALMADEESNTSPSAKTHPGTFYQTSRAALASLRVSQFLFARKFHPGSVRAEDIDILVASDVVPPDTVVDADVVTQDPLPFSMRKHRLKHISSFASALVVRMMGIGSSMPKVVLREGR